MDFELADMSAYAAEGFAIQTLVIEDTVSVQEGTIDGFSFCGERSITLTPELSWVTYQDDTITCGSLDVDLAPISQQITIEVTLVLFPTISISQTFTAELLYDTDEESEDIEEE